MRDGSGSHDVIFVLKACQAVSSGRKEGTSGGGERGKGEGGGGRGRVAGKGVKPVYLWEESDSRLPANNPEAFGFSPRLPEPLSLNFPSLTRFSLFSRPLRQAASPNLLELSIIVSLLFFPP